MSVETQSEEDNQAGTMEVEDSTSKTTKSRFSPIRNRLRTPEQRTATKEKKQFDAFNERSIHAKNISAAEMFSSKSTRWKDLLDLDITESDIDLFADRVECPNKERADTIRNTLLIGTSGKSNLRT